MLSRLQIIAVMIALAGAVSCGDGLGPVPRLDGQWIGENADIELRLVLYEKDGKVGGYAIVHNGGFTGAALGFTNYPVISGGYIRRVLTLTLPGDGADNPARTFVGSVRDSTISGTLTTPQWDVRLPITVELWCRIPGGCG